MLEFSFGLEFCLFVRKIATTYNFVSVFSFFDSNEYQILWGTVLGKKK